MIGSLFAGYKIVERLGGGNTGVVYKAYDSGRDIPVALKVLPDDLLTSEEKRARFMRESQAAVMLDHECIAKLLEVGEYHGCKYFVMEYVEGVSFRDFLERHPEGVALRDFFSLSIPILDGLAFAHSLGMVHRDLKPENIKLDIHGRPKVLDFGLVKFLNEEGRDDGFQTLTGMVLGSAHYMSPEQANGDALDARTDVFSLGIIFYEMLTGKNPFETHSPFSTMQRILSMDPVSIELVRQEVPLGLAEVVNTCLRKRQASRYENAGALLEALQTAQGEFQA